MVEHQPERKRFVLPVDGHEVTLSYVPRDGKVDMVHTFTPDALRGRGLARQVVEAALAWAEAEGLEVIPSCWYVAKVMDG